MKTLKDIESEICEIESKFKNGLHKISDYEYKKSCKKLEFLKMVKMYLETNPKEDFIENEMTRVEEIILKINKRFDVWKADLAPKNVDPKKYRSLFNSNTGISLLKKQLKTLKFIASND